MKVARLNARQQQHHAQECKAKSKISADATAQGDCAQETPPRSNLCLRCCCRPQWLSCFEAFFGGSGTAAAQIYFNPLTSLDTSKKCRPCPVHDRKFDVNKTIRCMPISNAQFTARCYTPGTAPAQERKDAEGQPADDATPRKSIPERFPVGAVLPALPPAAAQLLACRCRMTDRTAAQRPICPNGGRASASNTKQDDAADVDTTSHRFAINFKACSALSMCRMHASLSGHQVCTCWCERRLAAGADDGTVHNLLLAAQAAAALQVVRWQVNCLGLNAPLCHVRHCAC